MIHCVGFRHYADYLLLISGKGRKTIRVRKGNMDKKKRNSIIRYVILFVVFDVVAAALYLFFASEKTVEYTPPVSPVVTVRPERRIIDEGLSLTGYIESESMVPVIPFVSGTVDEYLIKAGDKVEKGETVATIDDRPYELQLRQAQAQVEGLEAAFARVEALKDSGGATAQEYDTLSAQLDAARAQLEAAELQLSYATVTAPITGTVIQATSSKGSVGSQEMPLAVIADLDSLIVNLKIGEKYFQQISSAGDNLKVTVSAPEGPSSEASVISIAPFIDPVSKTFTVRVKLLDPAGFVPGMFIRAEVVWSSEEYLTLPLEVRKLDGSVYAVTEDGRRAEYLSFDSEAEDSGFFAIPEEYENRDFIIRGQNGLLPGEEVRITGEER